MSYGIKELSFCTCILEHNKEKECIFLKLVNKGKTIFVSTITNIKESMFERFFTTLQESEIRDMINNQRTII